MYVTAVVCLLVCGVGGVNTGEDEFRFVLLMLMGEGVGSIICDGIGSNLFIDR